MKERTWYLFGNPKTRDRLNGLLRFWWKCIVYAFALIGVANVLFFVWSVFAI